MKIFALIFCLLLVACQQKQSTIYKVLDVHDGDTVYLKGLQSERLRVRLVGLDTPELAQAPWGNCARIAACHILRGTLKEPARLAAAQKKNYACDTDASVCDFAKDKVTATLQYDVQRIDKYKRSLGYVFNSKGEMLNQLLLEKGYAVIFTIGDNRKYLTRLKDAEAKARESQLNIWQPDLGLKSSPYEFRKRQHKPHKKH